ncbi:polysaccharide pyruvyl transferase family protein [Desulfosarcina alkanivorans]|nr:polysaccharide pyruvyl transferase family protein [Desulfosarcina alkanivorans]
MTFSRALKVKLIGWYGFNATGDDLMADCIRRLFQDCADQLSLRLEFDTDTKCHLAIVGGGTIIGCDSADIWPQIDATPAPLAVFGPGFRDMGPEACRQWQGTMKTIFERAVVAGVRGPLTVAALRKWDITSSASVIGDPAIGFRPLDTNRVKYQELESGTGRPLLGICIRHLKQPGFEERYLDAPETYARFASLIPEVLRYYDACPVFFSFCENEYDSDTMGARYLRDLLPVKYQHAPIVDFHADPMRVASLIARLDYLVCERMHPAILMWTLGKPCLMIDYQYSKAADFLAGIGMSEFCLRSDQLNVDGYMARLARLESVRQKVVREARVTFSRQQSLQRSLAMKAIVEAVAYERAAYGKSM